MLAAGASTRFGSSKQLHPYDGVPLVQRAVTAALNAGAAPVTVVLGANAEVVRSAVSPHPAVRTVLNSDWSSGIASSLRAGLLALDPAPDGILVTLADQPLVTADALIELIAQFNSGHRIVASSYAGIVGAPAVFGAEYIGELCELSGDRGAGAWLRTRIAEVKAVRVEAAEADIDTPGDALLLEET